MCPPTAVGVLRSIAQNLARVINSSPNLPHPYLTALEIRSRVPSFLILSNFRRPSSWSCDLTVLAVGGA